MAQEFTIKSQDIEDKINQLLPSQGGKQPGVDFSASTMVIPIVDLTETAQGSVLRQDLQSALSHDTLTTFSIKSATTTIVNTTGFWRVIGGVTVGYSASIDVKAAIAINDGFSTKKIFEFTAPNVGSDLAYAGTMIDFIVKLEAGDTLQGISNSAHGIMTGSVRQIADINGNLTNP